MRRSLAQRRKSLLDSETTTLLNFLARTWDATLSPAPQSDVFVVNDLFFVDDKRGHIIDGIITSTRQFDLLVDAFVKLLRIFWTVLHKVGPIDFSDEPGRLAL